MPEHIDIHRLNLTDLVMYQCGHENCIPSHSFGPAVRDHFLIHYIVQGKGVFQVNGMTYPLQAGQGFLICPGYVTYYQADAMDPWEYSWVGFHGIKAEGYLHQANLTQNTPIFTYMLDDFIESCFAQMLETKQLIKSREVRLLGLLYMFLSHLIETAAPPLHPLLENKREEYMQKAISFIERNYSRKISVQEISKYIGLDRSYFCSLFKAALSMSPQEFLIRFRMNKACALMPHSDLSIGDISRSVGYEDPLLFSKMFRKIYGVSPSMYRKNTSQA